MYRARKPHEKPKCFPHTEYQKYIGQEVNRERIQVLRVRNSLSSKIEVSVIDV